MSRRKQHVPWTTAGAASEQQHSADDVVRETGWVFNNQTGERSRSGGLRRDRRSRDAGLSAGVRARRPTGRRPDDRRDRLGHRADDLELHPHVRRRSWPATSTPRFSSGAARRSPSSACRPDLQTSHVADGRTLELADDSVDLAFSYITLQHCHHQDALALVREAVRVTRPGGHIALNFRTWTGRDALLWPAGKLTRATVQGARHRPRRWPAIARRPGSAGRPIAWPRPRCCARWVARSIRPRWCARRSDRRSGSGTSPRRRTWACTAAIGG